MGKLHAARHALGVTAVLVVATAACSGGGGSGSGESLGRFPDGATTENPSGADVPVAVDMTLPTGDVTGDTVPFEVPGDAGEARRVAREIGGAGMRTVTAAHECVVRTAGELLDWERERASGGGGIAGWLLESPRDRRLYLCPVEFSGLAGLVILSAEATDPPVQETWTGESLREMPGVFP